MVKIHNLGLPRIGQNRKLKFALENYWKGAIDKEALLATGKSVRTDNLALSSELDYLPVGDFSFYDQVLDTSFLLGAIPQRVKSNPCNPLDDYFRVARGQSASGCGCQVTASEMTKWFDTNYHYIVPELSKDSTFNLNAGNLLSQIKECRITGANAKPVIIGPVTWLWLAKTTDDSDKLQLLDRLLPVYQQLLALLQKQGIEWLQIDEPALVTELSGEWQLAYRYAYNSLNNSSVKLLLTSYFGRLEDNLELVTRLPVAGVHIDVTRSGKEALLLAEKLEAEQVLSLGVIDGRNIWKSDLNRILEFVGPLAKQKPDKLWLAPSCSLLHVPLSLDVESELDVEVKQWLAFASEKLQELVILGRAINKGREAVCEALQDNLRAVQARSESKRIHNSDVAQAVTSITPQDSERTSPFVERIRQQKERLDLPAFPTTTIGSFPQTTEIRKLRSAFKKGEIDPLAYRLGIRNEIQLCVETQENIGLDVLVHGEAERNDMVEYFGQQLNGFAFSQFGWVQSYGSRCVKPPMIFGDVCRPQNMTVEWIGYAQSLTAKQVKGMLTGPVTILNWSFVRDDIPRSETCRQIALAIRGEVLALEASGTNIIQIDEAALREGLPLRKSDWQAYLDWAVESFRLTANGVKDATQIHTHMCYSEFNDILAAIIALDADVITIENARSGDELLKALSKVAYPNHIGPGVYDIHSPNVPETEQITAKVQQMKNCIPAQNIWINPDCGLKTRQWQEVEPALRNMVQAAQQLRAEM